MTSFYQLLPRIGAVSATSSIFVAGHRGMVGSAIIRCLHRQGLNNVITRTRQELDLTQQGAVQQFFADVRPEFVILAAAEVGGVHANNAYPADFLRNNLLIQTNVIDAARVAGAKKLLFLGSSCIYPKFAPQPIKEEYLLTGELEGTNQWYAIAKIAGVKMCQAYRRQYGFDAITVMPTNLYGPGDNFHPENSHFAPALLRRFHEAKLSRAPFVEIWGTGTPRRELLHVDDLAEACVFLLRTYSDQQWLNVGTGEDETILELATRIARTVGFEGDIRLDRTKPDGTPRKVLDVSRIHALGWRPSIPLDTGLRETYDWYLANTDRLRGL